jgi:hypothetical protein
LLHVRCGIHFESFRRHSRKKKSRIQIDLKIARDSKEI